MIKINNKSNVLFPEGNNDVNSNKSNDMFLVMLNLAQINDTSVIKNIFTQTLSSIWRPATFEFASDSSLCSHFLEVRTTKNHFGFIKVNKEDNLNLVDKSLIHNCVAMVAVILENKLQGSQLRNVVAKLETENSMRKRTEENLNIVNQELKTAKEDSDAANRAKSAFLANMSHEIRTPLGAIIGFSDIIDNSDLSETDRRKFKDAIKRNGDMLLNIINDILDLSKVEADKLDINISDVPVLQVIDDVISIFAEKAHEKGIHLTSSNDENVLLTINSDHQRLRQILVNIVGNAVKFTDYGHISIHTKLLGKDRKSQLLSIDIKDTGKGVSKEQAQRLFQPFSQADSSTSRKYGGTGLGLILSKKLARLLGGDLILTSSSLGTGSVFTLTIDTLYSQNRREGTQKAVGTDDQLGLKPLSDFKILVVEDSPDSRLLISSVLRKWGANVYLAENGVEALEQLKVDKFNLVLMDIQMPIMDGNEATRIIRRKVSNQPVVAVTAHAFKEEHEKCLIAGFDAFISKPIDFDNLLKTIITVCS